MDSLGAVYVISLDRTPERWRDFQAQNGGVATLERFAAVDGRRLDPADLARRGLLSPDLQYAPGALGCALSHASLWRRCVEEGTALTVCEDDAILHPGFQAAATLAISSVADVDFILWGWNFNSVLAGRVFGDTPFAMGFDQDRMRVALQAFRAQPAAPALLRLHRALGTPAYTISPRGAEQMLERCFPLAPLSVFLPLVNREAPNNGIDIAMNAAYPEMKAYAAFPPLVLTLNDAGASTVG